MKDGPVSSSPTLFHFMKISTEENELTLRLQGQEERTLTATDQEKNSLAFANRRHGFFVLIEAPNRLAIDLHNDVATTNARFVGGAARLHCRYDNSLGFIQTQRSEEHTSELQSLRHLVCRLL